MMNALKDLKQLCATMNKEITEGDCIDTRISLSEFGMVSFEASFEVDTPEGGDLVIAYVDLTLEEVSLLSYVEINNEVVKGLVLNYNEQLKILYTEH